MKNILSLTRFWLYTVAILCLLQLACDGRKLEKIHTTYFDYPAPLEVSFNGPGESKVDAHIISHAVLVDALRKRFPNADVVLSDSTYLSQDRRTFVFHTMTKFKQQFQIEYNLKFDCDDFSTALKLFSQMLHNNNKYPTQAPAIGVFHYITTDGSGHAINILVDVVKQEDGEKKLNIWFVEPQANSPVTAEPPLTHREMDSAFFIKF